MTTVTERIISTLGTVPEKRLRLIELAREMAGPDGLDGKRLAAAQPEVNLAAAEARGYVAATEAARGALKRIQPVPGGAA